MLENKDDTIENFHSFLTKHIKENDLKSVFYLTFSYLFYFIFYYPKAEEIHFSYKMLNLLKKNFKKREKKTYL